MKTAFGYERIKQCVRFPPPPSISQHLHFWTIWPNLTKSDPLWTWRLPESFSFGFPHSRSADMGNDTSWHEILYDDEVFDKFGTCLGIILFLDAKLQCSRQMWYVFGCRFHGIILLTFVVWLVIFGTGGKHIMHFLCIKHYLKVISLNLVGVTKPWGYIWQMLRNQVLYLSNASAKRNDVGDDEQSTRKNYVTCLQLAKNKYVYCPILLSIHAQVQHASSCVRF
jgi:hypothetical protein